MKPVTAPILEALPERVINIHPSLLPKFGGKGFYGRFVHQAVLDSGDNVTGATLHQVSDVYDRGQIISQKEVAVKRQDKVEDPVLKELLRNRELEAFLREVAKYRPPNRYYSNKNLSSILENVDSNIDEFLDFIDYISQINIENERPKQEILSNEQMSDRLKTGVMIVSEEPTENKEKDDILRLKTKYHYDCLLNLQLIDGKVDDDNIEDVKCPYRNQMLNIMYNNLKYAEQKNPVLFYIESKPFDMAKTQKGGRKHIRKTKKGGYLGKSVSSVRKTIRSLSSSSVQEKKKKRRNRRKSNRQIQSVNPYN